PDALSPRRPDAPSPRHPDALPLAPGTTIDSTMTDQLTLPLARTVDRLPDLPDLRPMLARPLPEAFDSEQHLFEPWWGGARALISIGPSDRPRDGDVSLIGGEDVP